MALNTPASVPEQNDSMVRPNESRESSSTLESTREGLRALLGEVLESVDKDEASEAEVLAELEAGGELSPEVRANGTVSAPVEVVRGSARALLDSLEQDETVQSLGGAYMSSTVATA